MPSACVPMKLPITTADEATVPHRRRRRRMPAARLPEMTLRARGVVPPIVMPLDSKSAMPLFRLPIATVPVTSVPMKLP